MSAERGNLDISKRVVNPDVDAFLQEVASVCERHKMSIAHEDRQGGFIVEPYSEKNIEWLNEASFSRKKYDCG